MIMDDEGDLIELVCQVVAYIWSTGWKGKMAVIEALIIVSAMDILAAIFIGALLQLITGSL